MESRFKIDLNIYSGGPSGYFPVALYRRRVRCGLFRVTQDWEFIASFKDHADARAYYETIKNLPEYLD